MNPNPRITFLFPYRWLTEDREYFGKNVQKQIHKAIGTEGASLLRPIAGYTIQISYLSYMPVDIKLSKAEVQRILKPVFPNGKCLDVLVEYSQHKSRTMLPVMDFQIYF
jgi:hypothetical protein